MVKIFLGLFLTIMCVLYSVQREYWELFLNEHSAIIVVGGTFAVLIGSTPYGIIRQLIRLLFDAVVNGRNIHKVDNDIISLGSSRRLPQKSHNALINYASELWQDGVEVEILQRLLAIKLQQSCEINQTTVNALSNLAKYPPALGMTGTVIGLVGMFSQLSSNDPTQIGIALAMALTATFYGLFFANCFLLPLGDFLQLHVERKAAQDHRVYEMLIMVADDVANTIVEKAVRQPA